MTVRALYVPEEEQSFFLYRVRTIKLKIFCPLLGYVKSFFYLEAINPPGCISGGSPCMIGDVPYLSSLLSGVGRISRLLTDVSRGRHQWYFPDGTVTVSLHTWRLLPCSPGRAVVLL
jgi:hypothetical protein